MYQILFKVNCGTCGQSLNPTVSAGGVEYSHGNVDDCSESNVTLPIVTPEMLTVAFGAKKKAARPKAAAKKKGK